MTLDGRVRLMLAAQILAWISALPLFYYFVSSLASVSRTQAEARLGRPLPPEWEKVFINHGIPQNWPHGSTFTAGCGVGLLLALVLILAMEWALYKAHPKGGWMRRMIAATGSRRWS